MSLHYLSDTRFDELTRALAATSDPAEIAFILAEEGLVVPLSSRDPATPPPAPVREIMQTAK